MNTRILVVAIAVMLTACSGSSNNSNLDSATPAANGPAAPVAQTPDTSPPVSTPGSIDGSIPDSFLFISADLNAEDNALAEQTRTSCQADFTRLQSLLGTQSAVEVFHNAGQATVDVEWIDTDNLASATAAFGDGSLQRQGAGAVFSVSTNDSTGQSVCDVRPFESFGRDDTADTPATLTRIDGAIGSCAVDSARGDVAVQDVPLFQVNEGGVTYRYGRIARVYTINQGQSDEQSVTAHQSITSTLLADGGIQYTVSCTAPTLFPDGSSALISPNDIDDTPVSADDFLYLGRPWQETARIAQDAVNIVAIDAARSYITAAVNALNLNEAATVQRACPGGGTARALFVENNNDVTHQYEMLECVLADGMNLNGTHDTLNRNNDTQFSVARSLEERYAIQISAADGNTLSVDAELLEGITGSLPDECGLSDRETVLRVEVPFISFGNAVITSLAIEDIDTRTIQPAADGQACGIHVTQHGFSDSARIQGVLGDGSAAEFSVNRTGSLLRNDAGDVSFSGQDAMIRIYAPQPDDSLGFMASFNRINGATVTISENPGTVMFEDTWNFLEL